MLFEALLVASTLYVCHGEVYSDRPGEGCHPLQESNKEGVQQNPGSAGIQFKIADSRRGRERRSVE